MQLLKTRKFWLFTATTVAIIFMLVTLLAKKDGGLASTAQDKRIKSEKGRLPVAVFAAPQSDDPNEQTLRRIRNSRYDRRNPVPFDELRSDTKLRIRISDWFENMPVLPTLESDVILVGKVIDSNGYLSNDKTGAYSEFSINIEEIIKDDGRSLPGALVAAEREGAAVQLPDGRVIEVRIAHQGTPRVGQRYVFFLKYNDLGKSYDILTGYEIHEGHVIPLDEGGEFAQYEETDLNTFLNAVRSDAGRRSRIPKNRRSNQ